VNGATSLNMRHPGATFQLYLIQQASSDTI